MAHKEHKEEEAKNEDRFWFEDDDKGYLTLGQLFAYALFYGILLGLLLLLSTNLGSFIGSLFVENSDFEWRWPSPAWGIWMAAVGFLVLGGGIGWNSQRVWVVDGSWSPRVLAHVAVSLITFGLGAIIVVGLIAELVLD